MKQALTILPTLLMLAILLAGCGKKEPESMEPMSSETPMWWSSENMTVKACFMQTGSI